MIAPEHTRGLLATAQIALVHNVVVEEGRGVQKLDAGGKFDVVGAGIAADARGRDGEHRAQTFAAGIDKMTGEFRDHGDFGTHPLTDELVHVFHVLGDESLQLSDGVGTTPSFVIKWDNNAQNSLLKTQCSCAILYKAKHKWPLAARQAFSRITPRHGVSSRLGDLGRSLPIWVGNGTIQLQEKHMTELFRTNDMVLISFIEHSLREEGIETLVLDGHMSVMEGSIGILPRRMMVAEDDHERADAILEALRKEHGFSK